MKLLLLVLTGFAFFNAEAQKDKMPVQEANLEEIQAVKGHFDTDGVEDLLVIYSDTIESASNYLDTCITRKAVIYTGNSDGSYTQFYQTGTIFPCPQFTGRSDNYFDLLVLDLGKILWRTCIAPRFSSAYSIVTYIFTFSENIQAFTLTDYREQFFAKPEDDLATEIHLQEKALTGAGKKAFEMDEWQESGCIFSAKNVSIVSADLTYWNRLASEFEKKQLYDKALSIQEMILFYFPKDQKVLKRIDQLRKKL